MRDSIVDPLPREICPSLTVGIERSGYLRGSFRFVLRLRGGSLGPQRLAARIEVERAKLCEPCTHVLDRPQRIPAATQIIDQLRCIAHQSRRMSSADLEVATELGLVEQVRAPHRIERRRDELLA